MILRLTRTLIAAALVLPLSSWAAQADMQFGGNFVYVQQGASYMGIDTKDVTADRMTALKLKEERGVEVTMVDQDAPAAKAGLKEHDVILDYNGTRVEGQEQLRRLIRETPPGRTVTVGISRDGAPMSIKVQLEDRGKLIQRTFGGQRVVVPPVNIPEINIPSITIAQYAPVLGVQTENLGSQLAEYFGVKDGDGLLVKSVEKNSPADKGGLKAGDVIVKADNEKLSDRSDLSHALRNHRTGGKMTLGIIRDKKEQTLTVDLPERRSGTISSGGWVFDSDGEQFRTLQQQLRQQQIQLKQQLKPQLEKSMRELQRQRGELDRQMQELKRELQISLSKLRSSEI